jgi:Uma2 family endonuclease
MVRAIPEVLDPDRDDEPYEDHFIVLSGASWDDYQRILKIRGDRSAPRIAYSGGLLEIMSPSLDHESIKSLIGRLTEVFCLETGVEFTTAGSWTIKDKKKKVGVEPDECYIFGELPARRRPRRPDLAIEVIWTSAGIGSKLDLYRALGVREVWSWRRGVITPYVLRGSAYRKAERSQVLPNISLTELARYLDRPTTSQAIRDFRDAVRAAASHGSR